MVTALCGHWAEDRQRLDLFPPVRRRLGGLAAWRLGGLAAWQAPDADIERHATSCQVVDFEKNSVNGAPMAGPGPTIEADSSAPLALLAKEC
jgi:hypothetical protein